MNSVTDLAQMDRRALAAFWSDLVGAPVPPRMSRDLQGRILAFEMQAKAQGGLSARTRRDLARIATAADRAVSSGARGDKSALVAAVGPAPGTRLVREWNGTTHIVEVTETGILWQGRTWRSLSVVAREITGAHWSGPRFFGLTGRRS